MRVIAGKFGGRRLVSFDEGHIRPTTDRVKESLFNILATSMDDARVLDVFSGTGNLGIEALSRGAQSVTFVEKHPASIKIIRQNLELLKITEGFEILKTDALKFAAKYDGPPYDVVLIDPPFPLKICSQILEELERNGNISHPGTVFAIEHQEHEPLLEQIGELVRTDQRDYGDKRVSFFKRK